ncbi:MAG: glutamine amidotransferase [Planctomycetes bacterium]|nr:glutamine amidotransferase [Planctomycetota bacterium]
MPATPLLLLQTGHAPTAIVKRCGDFDKMFCQMGRLDRTAIRTVRVARGERAQRPEAYRGVLVTGSPAMVTDREPWSEATGAWLAQAVAAGVPVFAVCYGHQLLAQALGGEVGWLPEGPEVGTHRVTLSDAGRSHPLLAGCPPAFPANLAHSQTVLRLPAGAVVLASSQRDPHQIVAYSPTAVSVQFHPEFDGRTTRECIRWFAEENPDHGPRIRQESAHDTPVALGLLTSFLARLATPAGCR